MDEAGGGGGVGERRHGKITGHSGMRRNGAGPESISPNTPVAPWIPGSMLRIAPE
jgi:hypothetical protein